MANALHTSLYEEPYSNGAGQSELESPGTDVVNMSSVQRGYMHGFDYTTKRKAEVPVAELIDERYVDRRI